MRNSRPHESLWPNIIPTLIVVDEIREVLGQRITISSSYRNPGYNHAVGGEPASFHMRFMALDIQSAAGPAAMHACAKRLRGRKFTLPGNAGTFFFRGGIGLYRTFIHVDTRSVDANW